MTFISFMLPFGVRINSVLVFLPLIKQRKSAKYRLKFKWIRQFPESLIDNCRLSLEVYSFFQFEMGRWKISLSNGKIKKKN